MTTKWSPRPIEQTLDRFQRLAFSRSEPYASIIKTAAFQRLKDISFLGALNYTFSTRLSQKDCTRATHSLHVAALANYVATERGYCDDLKRHLVVAALLHDIGHVPLSHSVEAFTRNRLGQTHHDLGEAIIDGKVPGLRSLNRLLAGIVDRQVIIDLIEGNANCEGADLFAAPINIDTIDGILRTSAYFGDGPKTFLRRSLCLTKAAFLKTSLSPKQRGDLDAFWHLKHHVYQNRIHSRMGLLSDFVGSQYFFSKQSAVGHDDLVSTEGAWKKKYSDLFASLKVIKSKRALPSWLDQDLVSFKRREYRIEPNAVDHRRYAVYKVPDQISLKMHES
ncbi:MAG: HD domain-containing protein [Chloroflexia bacterium]|nr:HD domain-containing protein [Chloroflexia bacterium]